MSTSLIPFQFERFTVRTLTDVNGNLLFVAKDVAEAIGYEWNGTARISHVPEEWRGVTSVVTPRGTQEMAVLSEQGIYFFLGRSDKPAALPMQKWVAGEVLPAIRTTGRYMTPGVSQHKVSRSRPSDPIILQRRRADAIISSTLRVGRLLGTEPAIARMIAVEEARRETGIDYQWLLPSHNTQMISANAKKSCQFPGCLNRRPNT